ncbi:MAG: HAMP domain-containing histidine kinase [Lachnospiraceae bacterium]|nr:HAMP domain-containing histidine kinase [Lachnospiraceae bacterium]
MNRYKRFAAAFIMAEILIILISNAYFLKFKNTGYERIYKVDINRIVSQMKTGKDIRDINLDEYKYVVSVEKFEPQKNVKYDYTVEEINGVLYRFEYITEDNSLMIYAVNISLGVMFILTILLFLYLERKMIRPFVNITELPIELSKGNLSVPIKEEKSKFFGKFLWGMDMLREKLEDDRARELELIKERKTLILSLSHDVKTPLAAIDLYTKALKNGLYGSEEKKNEVLEGIEKNTAEIKRYINEISDASRKDFLSFNVINSEVYLHDAVDEIKNYYKEKMEQRHTQFEVESVNNCLIYGDKDRIVEVMQNIIENALKYGDGKAINITFSEEENCKLITITNTGCSLGEEEVPHLFDSFYRGKNSDKVFGSGLGLYICKELMHKMDGGIFAKTKDGIFEVTLVFRRI